MADLDITLKRKTGGAYDVLYPTTSWTQVESKPTTFTPTSHTHGNITNAGVLNNTPVTVGTGDFIVVGDTTTAAIERSTITFGTSTSTFLRNDGAWGTPAGGISGSGTANQITYWTGTSSLGALSTGTYPSLTELSYVKGVTSAIQTQLNNKPDGVEGHNSSQTPASTSTPVLVQSITLFANNYYQINFQGMWSKLSNGTPNAPVITMAVSNTTGTPTWNGVFEWLNTPTTTAYTVENNSVSITTSTTAVGFNPTVSTSAFGSTYFGIKGYFYTGTSDKIVSVYVATSLSSSAAVYVDRISMVATKVN